MCKMVLLSIVGLLAKLIVFHPFHVSVCDMTYDPKDKHLKISYRIFLDDLELGMQKHTADPTLDITKIGSESMALEQYILQHLELSVDNKKKALAYVGHEIEEDAMWCYIEIEKLRPFKSITVSNKLLFDVYLDQENLVHLRKNGEVRSLRLSATRSSGEITFD